MELRIPCHRPVILSVSVSDGVLGVSTVKTRTEGGIVFAQRKKSAQHPGLPQSAIGYGMRGFWWLPPEGMLARELARLGGHSYVRPAAIAGRRSFAPERNFASQFTPCCGTLRDRPLGQYHKRPFTFSAGLSAPPGFWLGGEPTTNYLVVYTEREDETCCLLNDLPLKHRCLRDVATFEFFWRIASFPSIMKDRPSKEPLRVWVPAGLVLLL